MNIIGLNLTNKDEFNNLNDSEQERDREAREKLNQELNEQTLDDEDFMRSKIHDDDLAFGREDIEYDLNAPGGANGEESIYSHKTTTILDEEKVSFMHIDHLPNLDNNSDESFGE